MKKLKRTAVSILLAVVFMAWNGFAQEETPLVEQARAAKPERYQFALDHGADIVPTKDGKSFYLFWLPKTQTSKRILVGLHGHGSWVFDEFFLWQPYLEKRGIGILALQWWFGGGEGTKDYYTPHQMYPLIESILREKKINPKRVLLHGFSRGSANVYALAALDRKVQNNFFALIIANSGGATENYPPNKAISSGLFGQDAFRNTRWVLYCGMQDPNPERDGCPAMERTAEWIKSFGGSIQKLIKDPDAGHGGFHHSPQYVDEALDLFEKFSK